jgi:hypothetical protein
VPFVIENQIVFKTELILLKKTAFLMYFHTAVFSKIFDFQSNQTVRGKEHYSKLPKESISVKRIYIKKRTVLNRN